MASIWNRNASNMHCRQNYKDKIILALKSKEYDYIWLQRKPLSQFLVNIIASRSKLIYDIDDALYTRQSGSAGKLKSSKPGSVKMIKRINHIIRKLHLYLPEAMSLPFMRANTIKMRSD